MRACSPCNGPGGSDEHHEWRTPGGREAVYIRNPENSRYGTVDLPFLPFVNKLIA